MDTIIPQLYEFDSKVFLTTFAVTPDLFQKALKDNDWDDNGPRYIHNFLLLGEYPSWLTFPVFFHHCDGKRLRDLLDMRYPHMFLISQRLKDLLENNGITGWKTYPIRLFDKKNKEIFGYYGFTVTGRGGALVRKLPAESFGQLWKEPIENRIYDVRQWDGSDIFFAYRRIIVTQRVMLLLKRYKIDAVEFRPIEEYVTVIISG